MKSREILAAGLIGTAIMGGSIESVEAKPNPKKRTICKTSFSGTSSISGGEAKKPLFQERSERKVTKCVTWVNSVIRRRQTEIDKIIVTLNDKQPAARIDCIEIDRDRRYSKEGTYIGGSTRLRTSMTFVPVGSDTPFHLIGSQTPKEPNPAPSESNTSCS